MVIFHSYVSLPEGTGYVIAIVSIGTDFAYADPMALKPREAKDSGHTAVLGRLIQATAGFTFRLQKIAG